MTALSHVFPLPLHVLLPLKKYSLKVLLQHRKAWMGKLHRFDYSTPSKDPRLTRSKQSAPNQQWPEDVLEKAGFDRQNGSEACNSYTRRSLHWKKTHSEV